MELARELHKVTRAVAMFRVRWSICFSQRFISVNIFGRGVRLSNNAVSQLLLIIAYEISRLIN